MKSPRRFSRMSGSTRRRIEDILAGRRRSRRVRIDPFELREVTVGADDCLQDIATERQMELAIPARFTPERATPATAGELVAADAQDRERARRRLAQIQEGIAVPHE